MGYYSDTAYAIVCKTEEDRDRLLTLITPEQRKIVLTEAEWDTPDRILFHDPSSKWYGGEHGYESVQAHEALMRAAEDANDDEDPISVGVFMRVGEDDTDFEHTSWGDDDDLPYPYDLLGLRRELVPSWEEDAL